MKPLFGIDITTDKKNEAINGEALITRRVDEQQFRGFEQRTESLEQTVERAKLPLPLRILQTVCGALSVIVLVVLIRAALEIGIATAYRNAPYVFYGGPVVALLWATLFLLSRKKEKSVMEEENADQMVAAIERDMQSIYDSLGVPADAVALDALTFRYKVKDGEAVAQTIGLGYTPYFTIDLKAFATEDALCLADLQSVHSIPREALRGIRTVKKRISVPNWNKEEEPRKGEFKKYSITVNNKSGLIFFKPYHVLEFWFEGELWGLYFPTWELESIERLTGLQATEE